MRARKIVRGLEEGLTVQNAVADHVVRQLKERGSLDAPRKRRSTRQIVDISEESCLVKTWDGEQTDDTESQD